MSEPFGDWLLESLVAVGGCGEIWRATRDDRDEPRAIKRLHTHLVRNEEARTQFGVEQMLATTLPQHVNVVHGEEAGEVEGRPYVALELVPGEDLRKILIPTEASAQVLLPRARALAIVRAACSGAAHLHAHGWVHGDVCPSNLVIDARRDGDHIVLIDLGVARKLGEAGSVRGTAAYMAPEQVRGGAWTTATDVFALGVVLWELIAGARLFHRGPTWLSQAAAVEQPAPPLPDPAIDAIAQAALAKDPAQRIPDVATLLARLATLTS
jgi:serine/threonine protein kinase